MAKEKVSLVQIGGAIDVVVVTYNSSNHLTRLASSIAKCNQVGSVVVVDNNSQDNSVAAARSLAWGAPVTVIALTDNPGFGASMNLGAATVVKPNSKLLLLNPDVDLPEPTLCRLSSSLDEDPTLAVVGAPLWTTSGAAVSSARAFPTAHSILHRYVTNADHSGEFSYADWVCGAAMLWRRSVFEMLEGFSTDFFLYFEDTDLCRRAHENGWRVGIDGRARAVHDQGHGIPTSLHLRRQSRISRRIYAAKWLGTKGMAAARTADLVDRASELLAGLHKRR